MAAGEGGDVPELDRLETAGVGGRPPADVAALTAGRQLVWGAYVTAVGAAVTSGIAVLLLRRLRLEEVSR